MTATGAYSDDRHQTPADLVLLDIKAWKPARYRRLTGGELGPTLDFARRLAARSTPVWVRYVLAPGLTDDLAEVDAVARSAAGLGNVERIDIVPFHRRIDIVPFHRPGAAKYDRLGIPVRLRDTAPPGRDLVERVRGRFVAAGLTSY
ncbi:hypothetical protein [Dactylosporangium sp. NPDC049140]|uniref:hypothetical protein n=1 Tax=Dactylosporangium sp. NPDC049140 TaxID=3155647 RepID=UPI0033E362E8